MGAMAGGSADKIRESWVERLPLFAGRPWLAAAITLILVGLALGLRLLLVPLWPTGLPFLTFLPAVLVASFLLGARMGVLATAASTAVAFALLVADPWRPSFVGGSAPAIVPFMALALFNVLLFHWMQSANAKLRAERARSAALAATRETLFRELQHRVSNNLQVAAGLLSLQKKQVSDDGARAAFDEAARRLGLIGRISRQLYEPDGDARSMQALLEPLCANVAEMSGRSGVKIDLHPCEDVQLAPDKALPLALIVAEAVANAIEHGFAGREDGAVEIAFERNADGGLVVEVRDDGHGLPQGFDTAASASLGLGIIRSLAEQLDGKFELLGGERTVARLSLPKGVE